MLLMTLDIVVKTDKKPYIWGVVKQVVYIKYQEKNGEKFRKHGQNRKRLDFFEIFVIMCLIPNWGDVS